MSGYLEVKLAGRRRAGATPAAAHRALSLFKAWKKQWVILRPSGTRERSGVLALHSSRGLSANSTVELPPGSTVCRAESRTRPYAFGVFLPGESRKPHILLAGQTESEAQMWMAKIRALLSGRHHFGRDILLKNSYDVSVIDNDFSRKCLLYGVHGTLTISSHGLLISQPTERQDTIFIPWRHFSNIKLTGSMNAPDKNKICVLSTNSWFGSGAGELTMFSLKAAELVRAVKEGRMDCGLLTSRDREKRVSRSEGDLHNWSYESAADGDTAGTRRSSWYSGPSEVSLDDTDLIMAKEANVVPSGQLLRCAAAADLYPISYEKHDLLSSVHKFSQAYADSLPDRRSCASVASGIYEEIPENVDPAQSKNSTQNIKKRDCNKENDTDTGQNKCNVDSKQLQLGSDSHFEENTYESVAECVYATMRRSGKRYLPPPLPPRAPNVTGSTKLNEAWTQPPETDEVDGNVTRHSSLGSIPRCCSASRRDASPQSSQEFLHSTKTLPKPNKTKPTFNYFRKRIKSDSRVLVKPEQTRLDDKTAVEPKKKRFDFNTPSKLELIKNLRVSKVLMRNLKISQKIGEAKSCECLDTDVQLPDVEKRCSKSVETLDKGYTDFAVDTPESPSDAADEGQDLSVLYSESDQLSLPQDIIELILRGRDDLAQMKMRQRNMIECDYMPMSPIGVMVVSRLPPMEEQYTVMRSPVPPQPPCVASADNVT